MALRSHGEGTWTAHGARQQVPAGSEPQRSQSYLPLVLANGSLESGADGKEPVAEGHTE